MNRADRDTCDFLEKLVQTILQSDYGLWCSVSARTRDAQCDLAVSVAPYMECRPGIEFNHPDALVVAMGPNLVAKGDWHVAQCAATQYVDWLTAPNPSRFTEIRVNA